MSRLPPVSFYYDCRHVFPLTWNSFTQMKKKNIEGLLDEMHAQIICFQGMLYLKALTENTDSAP